MAAQRWPLEKDQYVGYFDGCGQISKLNISGDQVFLLVSGQTDGKLKEHHYDPVNGIDYEIACVPLGTIGSPHLIEVEAGLQLGSIWNINPIDLQRST